MYFFYIDSLPGRVLKIGKISKKRVNWTREGQSEGFSRHKDAFVATSAAVHQIG